MVPKRRLLEFRRRGIVHKNTYYIFKVVYFFHFDEARQLNNKATLFTVLRQTKLQY